MLHARAHMMLHTWSLPDLDTLRVPPRLLRTGLVLLRFSGGDPTTFLGFEHQVTRLSGAELCATWVHLDSRINAAEGDWSNK
jgi:hypothetical protein